MILFGLMFFVGGVLLLRWGTALVMAVIALAGFLWLRRLGMVSEITEYLPEPSTHPHPAGT